MFIAKNDSYLEIVGAARGLPDHLSVKFNNVTGDTVEKLFSTLMCNSHDDFAIIRSKCKASVVLHDWFRSFELVFDSKAQLETVEQLLIMLEKKCDIFTPDFATELSALISCIKDDMLLANMS